MQSVRLEVEPIAQLQDDMPTAIRDTGTEWLEARGDMLLEALPAHL